VWAWRVLGDVALGDSKEGSFDDDERCSSATAALPSYTPASHILLQALPQNLIKRFAASRCTLVNAVRFLTSTVS